MATFLWQRRGRITLATTILAAAFFIFNGIRSNDPALATAGGDPYSVPLVTDTNPDPNIVETTITAEPAAVDVGGGVMASVLTFNGTVPGPEFRLKVGDTVIVHFTNNIAHDTGIHWHGIELANASDGTPIVQNQVPPGDTFVYKFIAPRPGIYWYHPHHHSSTNQVFKGMYGSIIVTDPNESALVGLGRIPGPADTKTVVLSDVTVCKAAGSNDAQTYAIPSVLPHASGGALPAQAGPHPVDLCETSPIDEDGVARPAFAAGDVPNIQKAGSSGQVNEGQMVLTNGMNVGGRAGSPAAPGALAGGASTMNVQAGQGLRLQFVNAATTRFFRLLLTDAAGAQIPLVRIGGQGGLLDAAVADGGVVAGFDFKYTSGEVVLDPGDRVDVVAAIPAAASGVLTLWTQDFERTGQGFAKLPTVPVMHLNVSGSTAVYTISAGSLLRGDPAIADPQETLGAPTAGLLDPAAIGKTGLFDPDIELTNNSGGSPLGINNFKGSHDFAGDYTAIPHELSARYAAIGETLELTVTNLTNAHHPFHLHGFSIQPIDLTKAASPTYTWPYRDFRDNIDVPAGYTLRFKTRLDDRALMDGVTGGGALGRWVFHCHIFFHAVFGMISEFVVTDGTGNERPFVNSDDTLEEVNEGQIASMNGTFVDPEAGAVVVSSSIGTIAQGAGTWSWSYTTTDGPSESELVYVTATDNLGNKDQIAFSLKVNNLPPAVTITSPADGTIFQLPDPVPVAAAFTDPGTADTHTCSIDWGDAVVTAGTVVEAAGAGTCAGSHTYATGGIKTIIVTITDNDGASDSASVTVDINTPPDCGPVVTSLDTLWPPNHQLQTVGISGATDADGDVVTLSFLTITQDEPLNGLGDGDTSPDAADVPGHSDQIRLRAERSGKSDGRVYRLLFKGDDGRGGTCSATRNVTVVKGQGTGPAIDSGLIVLSK